MANVSLVDFDHAVEFVHSSMKQPFLFSRSRSYQGNGIWTLMAASGAFTVEIDMETGAIVITKALPTATVMVGAVPLPEPQVKAMEMSYREWVAHFNQVLIEISGAPIEPETAEAKFIRLVRR